MSMALPGGLWDGNIIPEVILNITQTADRPAE